MAEAKAVKKTTKQSTVKSGSRTSVGKTPGTSSASSDIPASKAGRTKMREEARKKQRRISTVKEITMLVVLGLCLLCFVSLFIDGMAGLRDFTYFLFGKLMYVSPFVIILLTWVFLFHEFTPELIRRLCGTLLFFLAVHGIISAAAGPEAGGLPGRFMDLIVRNWAGNIGAYIVYILMIAAGGILITDISPSDWLKNRTDPESERNKVRRESGELRRENRELVREAQNQNELEELRKRNEALHRRVEQKNRDLNRYRNLRGIGDTRIVDSDDEAETTVFGGDKEFNTYETGNGTLSIYKGDDEFVRNNPGFSSYTNSGAVTNRKEHEDRKKRAEDTSFIPEIHVPDDMFPEQEKNKINKETSEDTSADPYASVRFEKKRAGKIRKDEFKELAAEKQENAGAETVIKAGRAEKDQEEKKDRKQLRNPFIKEPLHTEKDTKETVSVSSVSDEISDDDFLNDFLSNYDREQEEPDLTPEEELDMLYSSLGDDENPADTYTENKEPPAADAMSSVKPERRKNNVPEDAADSFRRSEALYDDIFGETDHEAVKKEPVGDSSARPHSDETEKTYGSEDPYRKTVVTANGKFIDVETDHAVRPAASAGSPVKMPEEPVKKAEPVVIHEEPEKEYEFPPFDLLKRGSGSGISRDELEKELRENAEKLQRTLKTFGVGVTITNISCGPTVTRYEILPEMGVKVSKIVSLTDDIKLNLAAQDIRMEAPIPGKSAIGIEIPNKYKQSVVLRDLMENESFTKTKSKLAFAAGRDLEGNVIVADIAKMPHVLVAGATGSGKSVCINTMIMSIIYHARPTEVKLIMVDPKVVELSVYNGIPHLLLPVVTDPKKAASALNWAVAEMEKRYVSFAKYGVRGIEGFNEMVDRDAPADESGQPVRRMPQILIIVDELADLMMVAPGDVESAICRLAQKARAAGIHLVLATQRPSVDVITGLIKANIPSRIAFSVSSGTDSRTILDMNGAEKLLGRGDMLYSPAGSSKPIRVQGAFVSDDEVKSVVDFVSDQGSVKGGNSESIDLNSQNGGTGGQGASDRDEYFADAGRLVIDKEKASIGMLQRAFKLGFNRAARIVDQLCDAGVVGEEEGTKPRKVLMTAAEFENYLNEQGES